MKIKKHLISLFIILLHVFILHAQNDKIEELELRLKNAKEDTTRVITLYKLAVHHNFLGDHKKALNYAQQSIKLGEAIHFTSGCAGAYNNAGVSYFYMGKYAEALKDYLIALKYSEEAKNNEVKANTCINIGIIYAIQKEYNNAIKYFKDASKVLREINDVKALGELYSNLGSLYFEQGNLDEALTNDSLALIYFREWGFKEGIISTYNNIGDIYKARENYEKALKYNFDALKIAGEINDKSGKAFCHNRIGEIYIKQHKNSEAIIYFKKGLTLSKEIGSLNYISEAYKNLSEAYIAQRDYSNALACYKNHVLFKDSIFNEENTKKIVQSQMQYEFDKKEAATKAKQQIKDAVAKEEIQKQRLLKTSIAGGAVFLILIMLLILNRRKTTYELKVNKLENKTLRSQLNPHFIFNALASIQKYLSEYPELAENYLAKFGKLMREVLDNSEKDYISLSDEFAMLKKYMDLEKLRLTEGFDYEFIIDKSVDEETVQIPPLIFQPVIENAIWHGVASGKSKGKIFIHIALQNELLRIEVRNESKEPLAERILVTEDMEKKKSFGLQIVRERLALLLKEKRRKGNLELIPILNGMKVIIEIPI